MLPKRRQKSRSPRCELHDGGASRSEPPPPGSFSFPGEGAWNHARRLIVLLVASAVSLSLGDRVGGLIIIAMVLLSVLLNFFMEFQARHAVEEIRKQVATCAVVPHRMVRGIPGHADAGGVRDPDGGSTRSRAVPTDPC